MASTPAGADYVDLSYLLDKDKIKLVLTTCDVKNRRVTKAGPISWSVVKQTAGSDNAVSLPTGAHRSPKALTVSKRRNRSQGLHAARRCETASRTAKALGATLKTIRSQPAPEPAGDATRRAALHVASDLPKRALIEHHGAWNAAGKRAGLSSGPSQCLSRTGDHAQNARALRHRRTVTRPAPEPGTSPGPGRRIRPKRKPSASPLRRYHHSNKFVAHAMRMADQAAVGPPLRTARAQALLLLCTIRLDIIITNLQNINLSNGWMSSLLSVQSFPGVTVGTPRRSRMADRSLP
jgi:hypothetical protein